MALKRGSVARTARQQEAGFWQADGVSSRWIERLRSIADPKGGSADRSKTVKDYKETK